MGPCPSCGRELPGDFPFCPFCGAALAEPSRAAAPEERKVVTVLFCDLVGFTARAEQLDPEDVLAVLSPYHAQVRAELERFGGTVEKFIGDAVMAVYGAPVAHEDDPERAVRAALSIRDWAEDVGVELRIGVNTGEAIVVPGAEPLAAGDVVNTAARLQSAAPPRGVLVGEATHRATRDVIAYGDASTIEAKGKSAPVLVWEALEARSRVRVEREARAPLVGRERELTLLRETLERVNVQRELQLVTLVGVPGIGKSRLVYEIFRSIEQGGRLTYWRYGRSLPYGEGVAFWALAEIVKAQAGVLETDVPERTERKLHEAVAAVVADEDVAVVERELRPLVGLDAARGEDDRRGEAFAAWRRFLEGLAEQRPLVLVFEDLHWADDALLDFVDHLVDWVRGVPVLVLATARPELLERRPAWGGGKANAATISLAPLSDAETATLVHFLLDAPVLPAETQTELLARAGGNPLYAEEFARLAAEGRSPEELPENVQGLIAARLDALSQEEKGLLQAAAVLGKVFWLGAVAAIAGTSRQAAENQLHGLERKEFVRRERRSSVAGEVEYVFRHLLVRDVAYGQVSRAGRAERHRLAAEWIDSLGRAAADAETIAHHYLTALDLTRAVGGDDRALAERARSAAHAAGDRALTLNAFRSAAALYSRALSLAAGDDPDRPELLLRLGQALYLTYDERAEETLERASREFQATGRGERAAEAHQLLALVWWDRGKQRESLEQLELAVSLLGDQDSVAKARTLAGLASSLGLSGDSERAVRVGREALVLAERLGLDDVRAHVLDTVGNARFRSGDPDGVRDAEQGLELALAIGSHVAARTYNNLSVVAMASGDVRRCAELLEEGRRQGERFGDERMLRFVQGKPEHLYFLGQWDEALRQADAFVADCEVRPHYLEGLVRVVRSAIALARDDVEGATADIRRAAELAHETKDPQTVLPTLAMQLRVESELGHTEAAVIVAQAILGQTYALSIVSSPAVALAWTAESLDLKDEAREWILSTPIRSLWNDAAVLILDDRLTDAANLFARIGSLPDEAHARLRAAEAGDLGQLERALAFYRSVGAARYIRHGEAVLAASA